MTAAAPTGRDRLIRFAAVGVVACAVDMAVVEALTRAGAAGPYAARVVSYLVAATTAWGLNRTVTFADRKSAGAIREWARYLTVNLGGGAVNYAVYAALVAASPLFAGTPSLAVAVGSLAGMAANFAASQAFVFRKDATRC